jgi:hypothetical protein
MTTIDISEWNVTLECGVFQCHTPENTWRRRRLEIKAAER